MQAVYFKAQRPVGIQILMWYVRHGLILVLYIFSKICLKSIHYRGHTILGWTKGQIVGQLFLYSKPNLVELPLNYNCILCTIKNTTTFVIRIMTKSQRKLPTCKIII